MTTVIRYERDGENMRLTLKNVTNHELREVLVGLWGRMSPADRADHIRELTVYHNETDSWVSPVAAGIMLAGEGIMNEREDMFEIDLAALAARGEKIRP